MEIVNEKIILYQFNTSCISQYSYYIEHDNEAAIIDPVTDYEPYIELLNKRKSKLKYILNTHTHSDYITGSIDLAIKKTSTVINGPNSYVSINEFKNINKENYDKSITDNQTIKECLQDYNINLKYLDHNERIKLGKIEIELLHIPGHTLDSCCYVIIDGNGETICAFTGDTVLVGDIGKPDASVYEYNYFNEDYKNYNQKNLVEMLYNSLAYLIEKLPYNLTLYPSHSIGYPLGKHVNPGQATSLKDEKEVYNNIYIKHIFDSIDNNNNNNNKPKTKAIDEFINIINKNSIEANVNNTLNNKNSLKFDNYPNYFKNIVKRNYNYVTGNDYVYRLNKINKPVSLEDMISYVYINKEAVLLDSRHCFNEIEKGFIKNSILISNKSPFSIWSGQLINQDDGVIVICQANKEKDVIGKLLKVGFRNIYGYLENGFDNYYSNYKQVITNKVINCETANNNKNNTNNNCNNDNEFNNNFKILFNFNKNDFDFNIDKLIESNFSPINISIIKDKDAINYVYDNRYKILDVRENFEHLKGIFPNSICMSLTSINNNFNNKNMLDSNFKDITSKFNEDNIYILCKSGVRACMAYSLLIKNGVNKDKLFIIEGGLNKIQEKGIKV